MLVSVSRWKFLDATLAFAFLIAMVSCSAAQPIPPPTPSLPVVASPPASPTAVATATALPEAAATDTQLPPSAAPSATSASTETPLPEPVRFAVIGDYGTGGQAEGEVAALVQSWDPDFIITTGDNNYPDGAAETIDQNIGQFYHEFIYPYQGSYGSGADHNRFFPSLGNHDWYTPGAQPYLDYFELPGNERYYDLVWGPLHLFAIDGDPNEPDGVSSNSIQANWLRDQLAASASPWKIVYSHFPAYSSGRHGSIDWMRWPYKEWGATAIFAGHDHTYERLIVDDLLYFVNGLGGAAIYNFEAPVDGSQVRYNAEHGGMLVEASPAQIVFQFINIHGELIDSYTILAEQAVVYLPLIRNEVESALAAQSY